MSDEAEIRDEFAEQLSDESVPVSAMEVEDSIQAELSSEASSVTADTETPVRTGLSIAPVRMASEIGEDGQRKVPGIKIIGLSSELKKAMTGEESKETSAEEEDDDEEEASEGEEEDEEKEEVEDDETDDSVIETPIKTLKTPKVTIRKIAHVTTPGSSEATPLQAEAGVTSSGKKRGRPSREDLAVREKERREALAR